MGASERTFIIYMHTAPNGKRYVGQTCQRLEQRWRDGEGYKGCVHLEHAIKKYGWENFTHEVLCVVHSLEAANCFERYYILKFSSNDPNYGYNMTDGGSGGYAFTEEVRKKLSEKAQERGISPELNRKMKEGRARNGWRRRPMTDEEKQALSERMRGSNHPFYGKKMPKEWIEKRAEKVRGRKVSEETRRRQSEGLRNSEKVKAHQKAVLQYSEDGMLIARHEGMTVAANIVGCTKQAIRFACMGNTDTACGYRWEYEDDELRAEAEMRRKNRKDTSNIGSPVIQMDLEGNEIARFESTVKASKATGIPRYGITNCCRGRLKTSHGFIWQYVTDESTASQEAIFY